MDEPPVPLLRCGRSSGGGRLHPFERCNVKKLIAVLVAVLVPIVVLVGPAGADDAPSSRPPRVSLSASPVVGSTVSAQPAAWAPSPEQRTYEWLRDGEGEVIGRDASYTVTPDDAGHTLVVVERVRFGTSADETSSTPVPVTPAQAPVAAPAPAPAAGAPVAPAAVPPTVNTRRPTVKGTARVGKRLTVRARGAWTPAPTSFAYQWLRNGKKISGATKSSYRLTSRDRGKRLSVRVSALRPGVPTVAVSSKSSQRVR